MTDKLYITNRTSKPIMATISDNYTGNSVITYQLLPGSNELIVKHLDEGVYMMSLEDDTNDIFYRQLITKA